MILEVIGVNVQDVKDAEEYGADRIELCAGMSEGGLTPSYALIKQAVAATSLPVHVMVRPHADSFIYSKADLSLMCEDIQMIKQLDANGIVVGPITEEGTVDEAALQQLLEAAEGLNVTFHRGFDMVQDQKAALQTIFRYPQITTILTAGGSSTAPEGIKNLCKLQEIAKNSPVTIMPGSGLEVESFQDFYDKVKPAAIHFGSGVRWNHSYAERLSNTRIKALKTICLN